jgi:hypothetical protein
MLNGAGWKNWRAQGGITGEHLKMVPAKVGNNTPVVDKTDSGVTRIDCRLSGKNLSIRMEWLQWSARDCIEISMRWVMLRKSLLAFHLPVRKMQFSVY